MFCKEYFAYYQGHVFYFSYAKHVLKMGISTGGQLSSLGKDILEVYCSQFPVSLGNKKQMCFEEKLFYLNQCMELFSSAVWFCGQKFDFISKLSRRTWVVVEASGISERAVLCSVASLVPQSWGAPGNPVFFSTSSYFSHAFNVTVLPWFFWGFFSMWWGFLLWNRWSSLKLIFLVQNFIAVVTEHDGSWKRDPWSTCSSCSHCILTKLYWVLCSGGLGRRRWISLFSTLV